MDLLKRRRNHVERVASLTYKISTKKQKEASPAGTTQKRSIDKRVAAVGRGKEHHCRAYAGPTNLCLSSYVRVACWEVVCRAVKYCEHVCAV